MDAPSSAVRLTSAAPDVSSVLVVDDHCAFAEAIALYLQVGAGMTVTNVVHDGEQAIERVRDAPPDCVLLDIGLPGIDGVEATRRIKAMSPGTRVVLITGTSAADVLVDAIAAGADGLVPKEAPLADVVASIRQTSDAPLLDPATLHMLIRRAKERDESVSEIEEEAPELTGRELDVLRLLADGLAVKAIARELGITVNTCRGYVHGVLTKLGVSSQLAAVIAASRLGLIPGIGT